MLLQELLRRAQLLSNPHQISEQRQRQNTHLCLQLLRAHKKVTREEEHLLFLLEIISEPLSGQRTSPELELHVFPALLEISTLWCGPWSVSNSSLSTGEQHRQCSSSPPLGATGMCDSSGRCCFALRFSSVSSQRGETRTFCRKEQDWSREGLQEAVQEQQHPAGCMALWMLR